MYFHLPDDYMAQSITELHPKKIESVKILVCKHLIHAILLEPTYIMKEVLSCKTLKMVVSTCFSLI